MGAHSGKKISGNHQDRYYLTKSPRPLVVGSDSAGCGNSVGARKHPADHTRTHGIVIEDRSLNLLPMMGYLVADCALCMDACPDLQQLLGRISQY
ncbi:hypothetical protein BDV40DRAFT_265107 [Aspergillus tamarii]|uniref:Uncharacterized protein n=1 Tax=Aspergillus tamarii TaxID=41984 RepID=A0A5N6UUZ7_ASPTM|nr:hypothetical protein BDV40DRAFT_265107 [Aspergillus tamarii]